jgi:hypothetical protein
MQCDSDPAKPNASEIAIHRNKKIQSTKPYTEHVHFRSTLPTQKEHTATATKESTTCTPQDGQLDRNM